MTKKVKGVLFNVIQKKQTDGSSTIHVNCTDHTQQKEKDSRRHVSLAVLVHMEKMAEDFPHFLTRKYSMLPSIRTLKTKTQFLRRPFQLSVNEVFRMKAEHFSFKMKVLAS